MRRPLQFALVLTAVLLGFQSIAAPAHAQGRVALVIGQSAYKAVTALPNPANDARMMTQLLTDAGFEVVSASDLSQKDMRETVTAFANKVAAKGPDTIALVFYAGHGLQIDGENFLVPIDVDPKREADIPLQAVRLNDVLNTLASVPSRMRILLLDACRNNPFPELAKTSGHGFAIVDAKTSAAGTFISYSTSPGAEAEDGRGINSPYTTALLKAAREPGLSIEETFKRVRVAVNQDTGGRQTPWDSSSLTDAFRFFPQQGQDAARASTPKRSVDAWKKQLQGKTPQAAYELVIADDTVEAYAAFVAVVATPPYAPRVRSMLNRRREMVAWQGATFVNTEASYRAFLLAHPSSDLAATARRLEERQRTRALNTDTAGIGGAGPICPCGLPGAAPSSPAQRPSQPQRQRPANPPRRADTMPPAQPLPYTELQPLPWSSRFYAGVSGGYVRQPRSTTSITANDPDLLLSQQLGNVPDSLSSRGDGGIVGGQLGFMTRFGNMMVGVETDLSYNSARRSASVTIGGFDVTTSFQQEMQTFGTLRGRVGVAAGPTLVYATAGLAYGDVKASAYIAPGPLGVGGAVLSGAQDNWRVGWAAGAGIEQMITSNWSIKSEYLYYDLGETSFTAVTIAGTPTTENGTFKYRTNGHIVRAGLNFHF